MLKRTELYIVSPDKETQYIDIEISRDGRYGAPGLFRRPKTRPTPEQVKLHNQKMRERRAWRYIRANFLPDQDLWLTLTFAKDRRPGTEDEAKKVYAAFLRKLRRHYQKAETECKYMYCIEIGKKGAVHLHMILNRIPGIDEYLSRTWEEGHIYIKPLYEEDHFKPLAEYLVKGKIYNHSRNLIYPKETKKKLKGDDFRREPRAYKGYTIIKSTVEEGINIYTGIPYMHYTMIRSGTCRTDKKKKGKRQKDKGDKRT